MGLADTLNSLVQTAIKITDDLRTSVDYVQVTLGSYDPITDVVSKTETTTTVLAILTREKEAENDFIVPDSNTQFCLIAALDIPGVVPDVDDYLIIDGQIWEIMGKPTVTGNSLWKLKIRLP